MSDLVRYNNNGDTDFNVDRAISVAGGDRTKIILVISKIGV